MAGDLLAEKKALRREMLARRRALSAEERTRASEMICTRVRALTMLQEARTIMLYASTGEEIDLCPLMEELLAEGDRAIAEQRAERGITTGKRTEKDEETPEKKEASEKTAKNDTAEDISVMIINASGIDGAGAEIADTLRAKGFRIGGIETGSVSDRPKTAVMTAETHVNLFYGMPFPCVIMPVDGAGERQAIVIIGRDYRSDTVHKDGES